MMVRVSGLSFIFRDAMHGVTGVILLTPNLDVPHFCSTPTYVFNVDDVSIVAPPEHILFKTENISSTESCASSVALALKNALVV